MKPTIGRIVHFTDASGKDVRPAIISRVHNDTCVDVHIFEPHGGLNFRTSALLTSPGFGVEGWYWPQRDEAA